MQLETPVNRALRLEGDCLGAACAGTEHRACAVHRAGHLLRLRDAKGQPLSKARLLEEFAVFFIAGSETTGHTVAWTM